MPPAKGQAQSGPSQKTTLFSMWGKPKPASSQPAPAASAPAKAGPSSSAKPSTPSRPAASASSSSKASAKPDTPPATVDRAKKSASSSASPTRSDGSSLSSVPSPTDAKKTTAAKLPPSTAPATTNGKRSRAQPDAVPPTPPMSSPATTRAAPDADDDEDDEDVLPSRRATAKRHNYFESGDESDGSASDASSAPKPKRAKARPGQTRSFSGSNKKGKGRDHDDFIVPDDESEADDAGSMYASASDAASASGMDVDGDSDFDDDDAPKRKKGKPANKRASSSGGRLDSFKMGAAPSSVPSGSAVPASAKPRGTARSHLTQSERRRIDEKEKRMANEQAFSFLQDLRDKDGNRPGDAAYDPRTLYVPPSAWKTFSPFEKQFWEVKQNHWDTVLFFQKGKFYELYEEDALIGHREFDLKLTDRVKMKMVGVPESSFDMFAAKFLALGYKVGRVDQVETAVAKGMRTGEKSRGGGSEIVRRELRHVLTGGTIVDASSLPDDMGVYCLAIKEHIEAPDGGTAESVDAIPTFGLCILDAATAEFRMAEIVDDASRTKLETVLRSLRLKEIVHEKQGLSARTLRVLKTSVPPGCQLMALKPGDEFLDRDDTMRKLNILFNPDLTPPSKAGDLRGVKAVDPELLPEAISKMVDKEQAMSALGAMLRYLEDLNLDRDLCAARNFDVYDPIRQNKCLVLDAQSLTHLNVLTNEQGTDDGTLHKLLNRCSTPSGKRLFKIWLVAPLAEAQAIRERQDAVDDLMAASGFEDAFDAFAKKLPDIERIMPRIYSGKCKPKDFTSVLQALSRFDAAVERLLEEATDFKTNSVKALLVGMPSLNKAVSRLRKMFTVQEDGSFFPCPGIYPDFDDAEEALAQIEADLEKGLADAAKRVNLSKSQVKFKHIGTKEIYQVEVPIKTSVPGDWDIMSQTQSVKRYYPPAIARSVQELKEARETRLAALKRFHAQLFGEFAEEGPAFLTAVKGIAEIDCLLSLARASYAIGEPACRPEIVDSDRAFVAFEDLRHPCMANLGAADFIANDVALGSNSGSADASDIILLTGGNMAGKSTTARTTAVAVILAQLGCRVPASSARIAPVDRIASRMGAQDNLFQNASTFMVEMLEASRIVGECTPRSLVIMDELGRGTSTFDGQAIAFAVLHHLVGRTRCLGFFLTHYTSLAYEFDHYPCVRNMHMNVLVDDEAREVVFTYRLVPGIAESSYGTQVAALAGVPLEVCDRATSVSKEFAAASKQAQEQRKRSRIPLTTLSDFAHLLKSARDLGSPGVVKAAQQDRATADRVKLVGMQLEVIKAQARGAGGQKTQDAMEVDDETPTRGAETSVAAVKRSVSGPASYADRHSKRTRAILDDEEEGQEGPAQPSSGASTPRAAHGEEEALVSSPRRDVGVTSPPTSDVEDHDEGLSAPPSPSLKARSRSALAPRTAGATLSKPKVSEQLVLDFGQTKRTACKVCGMSYDRSDPGDTSLHARFHERSVKGIEWSGKMLLGAAEKVGEHVLPAAALKKLQSGSATSKVSSGDIMDGGEVQLLLYPLSHPDSNISRKLNLVKSNIDEALGASPLTESVRSQARIIVGVRNSRVLCAVIFGQTPTGKARRVNGPGEGTEMSDGGDAVFVSDPLPPQQTPPLAIHRIHVLPILRRSGLGRAMLDVALSRAVYGQSARDLIATYGSKANTTAFSQPTEAGRRLAEAWIAEDADQEAGQKEEHRLIVFSEA